MWTHKPQCSWIPLNGGFEPVKCKRGLHFQRYAWFHLLSIPLSGARQDRKSTMETVATAEEAGTRKFLARSKQRQCHISKQQRHIFRAVGSSELCSCCEQALAGVYFR